MFERFTEQARRVIFFARYEASMDGDPYIRCIHLLAAIGREAPTLFQQVGFPAEEVDKLRQSFAKRGPGRIGLSVEIPLDPAAGRAVTLSVEHADKFGHRWVQVAHLLGGTFHADSKFRTALEAAGMTETKIEACCKNAPATETAEFPSWPDFPPLGISKAGIGYDLHRLESGRKLVIGGIEVPFDKGPAGHSDGDVLSHAICDALLGAAGLGDIGTHFPDTDPKWKGVSSLLFLEQVRKLLAERGLSIAHVDAVVITEKPKLGPHFPAMREALAKALGIRAEQINLKAKTNEGVDAIGRGEAIAAHAIATLES